MTYQVSKAPMTTSLRCLHLKLNQQGTSHVSGGSGNMAQKSQAKTVLAGAATFVPAPVGNYR